MNSLSMRVIWELEVELLCATSCTVEDFGGWTRSPDQSTNFSETLTRGLGGSSSIVSET
jgi:hypothetical protein